MNAGQAEAPVVDCIRPPSAHPTITPITRHLPATNGHGNSWDAEDARTPRRLVVAGKPATIIEALVAALNVLSDLEVVGVASAEDSIVGVFDDDQPDAVVVYTPHLGSEVLDAVARLKSLAPGVRVIVLADRTNLPLLPQAAAAGVAACLALDTGLGDLIKAVRADTTDSMLVGASLLSSCDMIPDSATTGRAPATLTPRELEVLALLAEGCNPSAIAVRLMVSIYTARGHVKNLFRKLDAHSQVEAVAIATRMGLVRSADSPNLVGSGAT